MTVAPIRTEIRGGVLRIVLHGPFARSEFEQAFEQVLADPAYRAGLSLLIDTQGSNEDTSMKALRERLRFLMALREHAGGKCALIVTGLLRFGIGRMFAALAEAEGVEVRVFREVAEAEAWIGWSAA